jgi:hypothetical protein
MSSFHLIICFSMLALNVLIGNADCVLPVDNQALFDIVGRVDSQYQAQSKKDELRQNPASMIKCKAES